MLCRCGEKTFEQLIVARTSSHTKRYRTDMDSTPMHEPETEHHTTQIIQFTAGKQMLQSPASTTSQPDSHGSTRWSIKNVALYFCPYVH